MDGGRIKHGNPRWRQENPHIRLMEVFFTLDVQYLYADHGVRLPRARLAVGEDSRPSLVEDERHQGLRRALVHLCRTPHGPRTGIPRTPPQVFQHERHRRVSTTNAIAGFPTRTSQQVFQHEGHRRHSTTNAIAGFLTRLETLRAPLRAADRSRRTWCHASFLRTPEIRRRTRILLGEHSLTALIY